jgi:pimeloyl-ACP methyl ester carboxylesterase
VTKEGHRDGMLTPDIAERVYGVRLSGATVDDAGTAELGLQRRRECLGRPTSPPSPRTRWRTLPWCVTRGCDRVGIRDDRRGDRRALRPARVVLPDDELADRRRVGCHHRKVHRCCKRLLTFAVRAGTLRRPLLVLHGGADPVAAPGGARLIHGQAGSADEALTIYDGLFHEIFNEPEHDAVLADVIGWLRARA